MKEGQTWESFRTKDFGCQNLQDSNEPYVDFFLGQGIPSDLQPNMPKEVGFYLLLYQKETPELHLQKITKKKKKTGLDNEWITQPCFYTLLIKFFF